MPISYAGFDLCLESEELREYLECHLPTWETSLLSDFLGVGRTNRTEARNTNAPGAPGVPRPNYPDPPALKINSLYWPTGATRWGRYLGLCDTDTKQKIIDATGGSTSRPTGATLLLTDESTTPASQVAAKMYLLPPRRLTHIENGPALWLLPLVDVRYLWQFKNTGDLGIDAGETWSSYFNELGSRLGVSIATGSIASEYLYPDPLECSRPYENVAAILDAAAHSVGRRIVVDTDGTTVRAMDFDYAETRFDQNVALNWAQMMGGEFDSGFWATQATVELVCPKYVGSVQSCGTSMLEATVGDGYASTVRTIHTTAASMRTTFTGSESNTAALQSLADKIAEDLILSTYHYDRTFAGILNWLPTAWDDCITWEIGCLHEKWGYLARTRVQSMPANFGVDEMLHQVQTRVFPVGDYILKTTSTIPAMTSTTPGAGTAEIYVWDGDDLDATGIETEVVNMTTQEDVADDTWIQAKHDGCRLNVDVEDCPA
jgi:hypothetical protein